MLETAEKNSTQTMLGRGSHFMGDFLPVSTDENVFDVIKNYQRNFDHK